MCFMPSDFRHFLSFFFSFPHGNPSIHLVFQLFLLDSRGLVLTVRWWVKLVMGICYSRPPTLNQETVGEKPLSSLGGG